MMNSFFREYRQPAASTFPLNTIKGRHSRIKINPEFHNNFRVATYNIFTDKSVHSFLLMQVTEICWSIEHILFIHHLTQEWDVENFQTNVRLMHANTFVICIYILGDGQRVRSHSKSANHQNHVLHQSIPRYAGYRTQ